MAKPKKSEWVNAAFGIASDEEPEELMLKVIDGTTIEAIPNGEGAVSKAFSMARKEGGWVHITYYIQNGQIIKTVMTEPDFKAMVTERMAISNVKYWTSIG